jgi:hypothetical protein
MAVLGGCRRMAGVHGCRQLWPTCCLWVPAGPTYVDLHKSGEGYTLNGSITSSDQAMFTEWVAVCGLGFSHLLSPDP